MEQALYQDAVAAVQGWIVIAAEQAKRRLPDNSVQILWRQMLRDALQPSFGKCEGDDYICHQRRGPFFAEKP